MLMQRRVKIGRKAINPFAIAWKTAWYWHPIVRQVRGLTQSSSRNSSL